MQRVVNSKPVCLGGKLISNTALGLINTEQSGGLMSDDSITWLQREINYPYYLLEML